MHPIIQTIILLAFLHWIADFVCQTQWMSRNKSTSLKALGAHIAVYSAVLLLGLFIARLRMDLDGIVLFVLLNGSLHFVTDFFTSRATTHYYKQQNFHLFFVVIGFDQFIHLSTFLLTIGLLI